MDQNIIGLVLKTSGYPDQIAVSGCHGNQVNFKISVSKKIPNFTIIKKSTLQLKFLQLRVMRFMAFSTHGNHLFFIEANFVFLPPYPKNVLTSPPVCVSMATLATIVTI